MAVKKKKSGKSQLAEQGWTRRTDGTYSIPVPPKPKCSQCGGAYYCKPGCPNGDPYS